MQPPPEDRSRPGEVVWGPIGIEDAAAAGSRMPSASVVLRGIVDDELRTAEDTSAQRQKIHPSQRDRLCAAAAPLLVGACGTSSHRRGRRLRLDGAKLHRVWTTSFRLGVHAHASPRRVICVQMRDL